MLRYLNLQTAKCHVSILHCNLEIWRKMLRIDYLPRLQQWSSPHPISAVLPCWKAPCMAPLLFSCEMTFWEFSSHFKMSGMLLHHGRRRNILEEIPEKTNYICKNQLYLSASFVRNFVWILCRQRSKWKLWGRFQLASYSGWWGGQPLYQHSRWSFVIYSVFLGTSQNTV